jgi:hypothetical protein
MLQHKAPIYLPCHAGQNTTTDFQQKSKKKITVQLTIQTSNGSDTILNIL